MSAFSGKQHRGAMKIHREKKRLTAEARDEALPADSPKRRKNREAAK